MFIIEIKFINNARAYATPTGNGSRAKAIRFATLAEAQAHLATLPVYGFSSPIIREIAAPPSWLKASAARGWKLDI